MKKKKSRTLPSQTKHSPTNDSEDVTVSLFSAMAEVNVRVAVRVRPLLPKEKLAGEHVCVKLVPKTNQLILGKDRAFTFDHVITSKTSQDSVYDKCVEPLVKSCFDGYNATVFAYGQTGSGKTYTMGGGNMATLTEEETGIIPRAISNIFSHIQSQPNKDISVKVSYVEIYKEELRDLLDLETSTKDLHIREDDQGNTLITGAAELECESADDVLSCLEQGSAYRHTGSTQMNEHSSRSHSVFTLLIEQSWSDNEDGTAKTASRKREQKKNEDSEMILEDVGDIEHYMCAKFHFVDLAGSERAHRTGNVGDRFKESVHINSGLLALGNVISALGDIKKKVSHIPYRDSKITRLLKDSLGGNANTLMICCISPSSANLDESLNALKYANRARNIKNKPIVNRDPQSIRFEEMQSEIKALRAELHRQRTSLMSGVASEETGELQRAISDAGQIKSLEERTLRLQTECAHYKMIAEDAYKQLVDIQDRDILSQSQHFRLRDWLELMEEIKNKVPSTLNRDAWENQTISRLEVELKQCKSDLQSDEEIFAEKAKEVSTMTDKIAALEAANAEFLKKLEASEARVTEQDEELVEKQVRIDELLAELQEREKAPEIVEEEPVDSSLEMSSGPPTTSRRAKSVPVHMLGNRTARNTDTIRNIHTSPALFSLERVMQSFRARSQLLVSRLEDSDDVCQRQFSDDEVFSDDDDDDGEVVIGDTTQQGKDTRKQWTREPFQRGSKARSTYKVRRPKQQKAGLDMVDNKTETVSEDTLRKSQTDDEKLSLRSDSPRMKRPLTRGDTFTASDKPDVQNLRSSAEMKKSQLKRSEIEVRQSEQKVRDLNINIKMKTQLIKELIKTGKDAQVVNKQNEEKIKSLEVEKQAAKAELSSMQKAMIDLEQSKQQNKSEKEKLQIEFRKKIELAKTRIYSLQKKQKETEKMASLTSHNDKRITDLESAIEKMKNQQDQLQRRLKEETDLKVKLEREMHKEHQKIKELEIRTEQQKKVLKVKTEEVSGLQRRLRTGSQSSQNKFGATYTADKDKSDEQARQDEQKRWLDQEIEKVLEQRKQMEDVEKELGKREEIVAKKEAMLSERSELEIKKLRSSQVLNKDIITVSTKLDTVERILEEKSKEMAMTPRDAQPKLKDDIARLQQAKEKLRKQRSVLDSKHHNGAVLSKQEERRLIELEEAVDALDAAIDYKNESINSKKEELRRSVILSQSEDHFSSKLKSLTTAETRTLLTRYFEKVIDLREAERHHNLQCSQMEMKLDEQDRLMHELEASLQRAVLDTDRKLTQQQQEYEKKIQLLMHQLMDAESTRGSVASAAGVVDKDVQARVDQLEKDLYFYKKTSRDLKKKLRELMSGIIASGGDASRAVTSENGESLTSRSSKSITSLPGTASSRGVGELVSPRDKHASPRDKPASSRDSVATSVKISRRDLRRMSEEEVSQRLSARRTGDDQSLPTDSLEVSKNPWS